MIVVPKSNPAGIESIYDLAKPGIKIDVAAPAVPVGALHAADPEEHEPDRAACTPNVVSQETDVRTVLSKVALGQADAGFVYATDAQDGPERGEGDQGAGVGAAEGAPTRWRSSSKSPNKAAAQAFIKRVLEQAGQAKLRASGFLALPSRRSAGASQAA